MSFPRLLFLASTVIALFACSSSSSGGRGDATDTGVESTDSAVDSADTTDSATGVTTADALDSADGNDGRDGADQSTAVDGSDMRDGSDATDGESTGPNTDGDDGTDEPDGSDGEDTGPVEPDIPGGTVEALGCWAPSDITGIDCTEFCALQACAMPQCETTCPYFFAFYESPQVANEYMSCVVESECTSQSFGAGCLEEIQAPNAVPPDCDVLAGLLEACDSSQAQTLSAWCAEVGPYLKPNVLATATACLEKGCSVDPVECLLEASCIMYHVFEPEEGGADSGPGDDGDDGGPNGDDGGPGGDDGGPGGDDGGPGGDGSDDGPGGSSGGDDASDGQTGF